MKGFIVALALVAVIALCVTLNTVSLASMIDEFDRKIGECESSEDYLLLEEDYNRLVSLMVLTVPDGALEGLDRLYNGCIISGTEENKICLLLKLKEIRQIAVFDLRTLF